MRDEGIEIAPSWHGRIDRSAGPSACWPWTGSCMTNGYGQSRIRQNGRWRGAGAHQIAHFVATGRWEKASEGRLVRHLCHNRLCCNPAHLRGGTSQDNADDRTARARGEPLLGASFSLPVDGVAWEEDEAGWLVTRFHCASGVPLWRVASLVQKTLLGRHVSPFQIVVHRAAADLRVSPEATSKLLKRALASRSQAPDLRTLRALTKPERPSA